MNLTKKASELIGLVKSNWKTPPKGRYMNFKEILSLSVGGIGVKFIVYCVSNMVLSVGNTLIGNTIGIDPQPLYIIYLISILSGFPLTALRAKMIDNSRSMKGKYRPYILRMGIPTVILGIGFIYMPYENMTLTAKCVVVLLFNIGFQFFYNFMNDSYDSLINVLSPNTVERSDVCSIKAVIENLSPSIAGIFLPIAARLITGSNTLYDLRVYRVLYPPMLAVGFLISLLVYVNTKEKIVQAKTHVISVKFSDAFRAVMRNKYFWIISLAGWIGFLEGSFNSILGWMYSYQNACSAAQYSLITAIVGNASFWPNIVAPFLIRKYGKKKIVIFTNLLNIVFIFLMLPVVRINGSNHMIWFLLVFIFINQFLSSLGYQMNPSLNADIRDYQQYKTGERIDGMFAAVGLIGSVITLGTGFVLPLIYDRAGLNRTVALSLGLNGSNVYDVLYNSEYFVRICSILIIASVVGAALNVIPFFFYDLTETKQKAMVTVLKIRALFEDYGNNALKKEEMGEAINIIKEANEFYGKEFNVISRNSLKNAKKSKDKDLIEEEKATIKNMRAENEKIEIARFVLSELNRFDTPEGIADIEAAKKFTSAGLTNYLSIDMPSMKEARAMAHNTSAETEKRRDVIDNIRNIRRAKKTMKKYYPDGILEFDKTVFDELFESEDKTENLIHDTVQSLKSARENGDKENIKELKKELSSLQREKVRINREIKTAVNQNSIYTRAAKPYLDAKKILTQSDNYKHFDDILAMYDDCDTE